jgi:transcriptional antiterminator
MFGIKELKNEIADINRKLERILWILSDKPQSIDESFKQQFISEVDQAYKRRTKSVVKYKKLKTSLKTIDKLVSVLCERPYTVKQLSIKLNLTENSVRTYLRDARTVGHKIDRNTKRRNGKLVSYYTMEV